MDEVCMYCTISLVLKVAWTFPLRLVLGLGLGLGLRLKVPWRPCDWPDANVTSFYPNPASPWALPAPCQIKVRARVGVRVRVRVRFRPAP